MKDFGPNTVNEQQRFFQKGSTPYLRGDVDPTYLRKASDKPLVGGFLVVAAGGWVFAGVSFYKMFNDIKN